MHIFLIQTESNFLFYGTEEELLTLSTHTYSENNNCKHDDDDVRDGIEIFKEKKM